jgi:hypothetical protein
MKTPDGHSLPKKTPHTHTHTHTHTYIQKGKSQKASPEKISHTTKRETKKYLFIVEIISFASSTDENEIGKFSFNFAGEQCTTKTSIAF